MDTDVFAKLRVQENGWGLVTYAAICQENGFGPIVEFEILVDGDHSIKGTGALRIGFDFIKRFIPADVQVSRPTWGNHNQIISQVGLYQIQYPYFDAKTRGFDVKGALDTLSKARPGSVVLLHVCAHNPTGVDPTEQQWLQIAEVCKRRRLVPFFDCAYQGFATGDLDSFDSEIQQFYNSLQYVQ